MPHHDRLDGARRHHAAAREALALAASRARATRGIAASLSPRNIALDIARERHREAGDRLRLAIMAEPASPRGPAAETTWHDERLEGLMLVHRKNHGRGAPDWEISARGRALLDSPPPPPPSVWPTLARRLPGAARDALVQAVCGLSVPVAVAVLAAAWSCAVVMDRAGRLLPGAAGIDANGRPV